MSLSVTLSSALSGLQANSRAAELVSSNVANALTEGYGRRELALSARSAGGTGGGVSVAGIVRVADPVLQSDRRIAGAGAAGSGTTSGFYATAEAAIGTPDDSASLGGQVDALDRALLAAASRPDSEARLDEVLRASRTLSSHLNAASRTVQDERARADDRIAQQVEDLNTTLAKVTELNSRILRQVAADRDASPLMDQRQQLVDRIADIVPMREIARDDGQIALVTTGGAILIDAGRAATFGFVPAGTVTSDMTLESGALSGLTLNGRPVTFRNGTGPMDGGTLAADFRIRDRDAVEVQAQLDAVARDLIARFSDPAVDSTLPSGAAGLFTDAGRAFDPAVETGLADRIVVNPAVDPDAGGALWRLRDGIGATVEGPSGRSALLTALRDALTARLQPASGGFTPGERSASGLVSDMLSRVSSARIAAEDDQSYAIAKRDVLRNDELAMGVDSDQQTQQLLLIEQSYAANARVVSAVDAMLKLLLEM